MLTQVSGSESTAVYMEDYSGPERTNQTASHSWITIAAANMLPDVLVRLASTIVSTRGMDIIRASLDQIDDPVNKIPDVPMTGCVSMLRILVSPSPAGHSTTHLDASVFQATLQRELERAKWLDDEVTDMGLLRYPQLGRC